MALPPATTAQVTLKFQPGGGTHFAFCVLLVGNNTDLDPDQVAGRVRIAFGDSLDSLMTEEWNMVDVHAITETGAEFHDTAPVSGDYVGTAAPPNVALLLRKDTGLAGRPNRGRMYLPGIPEAEFNVAGSLVPTFVADANVAAEAFFDKLVADDVPLLLHHRGPNTFTAVSSLTADGVVATQRRRVR